MQLRFKEMEKEKKKRKNEKKTSITDSQQP